MAYEIRTPDMQIAATALRHVIADGGTMDIKRMNAMTGACKALGDTVVKDTKVRLADLQLRQQEAKLVEASKLHDAVTKQIEISAAA